MRQVLIIFRKDFLHFWPEMLGVFAISITFALAYPHAWDYNEGIDDLAHGFHLNSNQWGILANTAGVLMPVSWLVLIARVVHGENLVGARQFWITRPYHWPSLAAEKMLFCGLAILVPFTVAQIMLLHAAGFWARDCIAGLVFVALIMTGLAILPFLAFASVISTLVRIIGVLLAIVVLVLLAAFITSGFHTTYKPSLYTPYQDKLALPALIVLSVAVLLIQYSSRRLWLSRALLIAAPLTAALLAAAPFEGTLFDHYYPALNQSRSTLEMHVDDRVTIQNDSLTNQTPGVQLALEASGIDPQTALGADDVRVDFVAPGGDHYQADWQSTVGSGKLLSPGGKDLVYVQVAQNFIDKHKHEPLTLHLELAFTQFVAGKAASALSPGGTGTYSVPGLGVCRSTEAGMSAFHCQSPFRPPHLALVTAQARHEPCSRTDGDAQVTLSVWTGALNSDPADVSFLPIVETYLGMGGGTPTLPGQKVPIPYVLCAGAPITVTQYDVQRRFRYSFTQHDIKLVILPPRSQNLLIDSFPE